VSPRTDHSRDDASEGRLSVAVGFDSRVLLLTPPQPLSPAARSPSSASPLARAAIMAAAAAAAAASSGSPRSGPEGCADTGSLPLPGLATLLPCKRLPDEAGLSELPAALRMHVVRASPSPPSPPPAARPARTSATPPPPSFLRGFGLPRPPILPPPLPPPPPPNPPQQPQAAAAPFGPAVPRPIRERRQWPHDPATQAPGALRLPLPRWMLSQHNYPQTRRPPTFTGQRKANGRKKAPK
jgi:hypothetical protein